ncbi:ankyrin repeat domain-containing protein [Microbulbifer sp. TRSA005]|uniref:ankyrin repeat domain-containing protein n=1 Tax=unclassified Microbulbifer TaxID=2619833 RepID=UPI004039AAC4
MNKIKFVVILMSVLVSNSSLACDLFSKIIDGNPIDVELCLKAGADVNKKSAMANASPLVIAVNHSGRISPKIVKSLIDAGAKVNYMDDHGVIPLITASKKGYIEVVKLLISGGANVDIKDKKGRTPLIMAAINNQLEAVKMLVAHGADPRIKDNSGQDAIARAKSWKRNDIVAYLESLKNT